MLATPSTGFSPRSFRCRAPDPGRAAPVVRERDGERRCFDSEMSKKLAEGTGGRHTRPEPTSRSLPTAGLRTLGTAMGRRGGALLACGSRSAFVAVAEVLSRATACSSARLRAGTDRRGRVSRSPRCSSRDARVSGNVCRVFSFRRRARTSGLPAAASHRCGACACRRVFAPLSGGEAVGTQARSSRSGT